MPSSRSSGAVGVGADDAGRIVGIEGVAAEGQVQHVEVHAAEAQDLLGHGHVVDLAAVHVVVVGVVGLDAGGERPARSGAGCSVAHGCAGYGSGSGHATWTVAAGTSWRMQADDERAVPLPRLEPLEAGDRWAGDDGRRRRLHVLGVHPRVPAVDAGVDDADVAILAGVGLARAIGPDGPAWSNGTNDQCDAEPEDVVHPHHPGPPQAVGHHRAVEHVEQRALVRLEPEPGGAEGGVLLGGS